MNQTQLIQSLRKKIKPEKAMHYPKFFKTGKGEYGEGDKFLGVVVPDIRRIAKVNRNLAKSEVIKLLKNEFHECRMLALIVMSDQYRRSEESEKEKIYQIYIENTLFINNWDLVDISCPTIVGEHLLNRPRGILFEFADSGDLWKERISIISTLAFIRRMDFKDTLLLAEKFLTHNHDLIHKASGWMLREVGKRSIRELYSFLDKHFQSMPRTMLRYSIEKLDPVKKKKYMGK